MNKRLALAVILGSVMGGSAGVAGLGCYAPLERGFPKTPKTKADFERLAKAKAKRQRKAAKKGQR